MYEIILFSLTTVGYLLYIQFSPGMGQIWIRCGKFSPMGAIKVIMFPFKETRMWTMTSMWSINYWIWLLVAIIILLIIKGLSFVTNSLYCLKPLDN